MARYHLLTVTAILSLVATGAWGACDHLSCQKCGADAACEWCAAFVIPPPSAPTPAPEEYLFLGKCQPKEACKNVEFGTIGDFLKKQRLAELVFKSVPKTSDICDEREYPREVFTPDCFTCVKRGDDAAWCQITVKAPQSDAVSKLLSSTVGLCLRTDLQFLCNKGVVPWEFEPFTEFKSHVSMRLDKTDAQCYDGPPSPPPKPSATCEDNLNCQTCNASSSKCTWCGLVLADDAPLRLLSSGLLPRMLQGSNRAALFGTCRSSADCGKVHFGTFPDKINEIEKEELFKVKGMKETDPFCTTVQWPKHFAQPDCKHCVKEAKSGWCYSTEVDAGICLAEGVKSFCFDIGFTWLDQAEQCSVGSTTTAGPPRTAGPTTTAGPPRTAGPTTTPSVRTRSSAVVSKYSGAATLALTVIALGAYAV